MQLISDLLQYKSLSIVGLEKNTGKTETLNFILRNLQYSSKIVGVTSVGIDGEKQDQVTLTAKPEITLYERMLFTTSEQYYLNRQLVSEIISLPAIQTALGRLVTARVLTAGQVLLAGPVSTSSLKKIIAENEALGADITIVDGAFSRLSLASPTVTEALILATGAALSPHLPILIAKTQFVVDLIKLPQVKSTLLDKLAHLDKGIFAVDNALQIHDLEIGSVFNFEANKNLLTHYGNTLYVGGVVNDKLLNFLRLQNKGEMHLIVKDFSKIMVSRDVYDRFLKNGGTIEVLYRAKLASVTFNPTSPSGCVLDSDTACKTLSEQLQLPVYDVRKIKGSI